MDVRPALPPPTRAHKVETYLALGSARKASQTSNAGISLEKEFSTLGDKDGGSTILAGECLEVLFLFFAGNDIVPVGLSIPDGDLVDVASSVPFDEETNDEPVVRASEAPIITKAGNGSQGDVGDGIVELLDLSPDAGRLGFGR